MVEKHGYHPPSNPTNKYYIQFKNPNGLYIFAGGTVKAEGQTITLTQEDGSYKATVTDDSSDPWEAENIVTN